jgi:pyridine nucleotide-disulfide oxidoreductase family protein
MALDCSLERDHENDAFRAVAIAHHIEGCRNNCGCVATLDRRDELAFSLKHPGVLRLKHLVLVGGGHAHALVLRALIDEPEPGIAITLVAPDRHSPYSGMLPGHIAGLYTRDEMHIDLARLAQRLGARFVEDKAVAFDGAARQVTLANGEVLSFDVLSIDIGITPDIAAIEGAREHALSVKPIGDLLEKTDRLIASARTPGGPKRFAVVGGGAAGICLAFALAARLRGGDGEAHGYDFVVVTAGELLPEVNTLARLLVKRALERRGIALRTHSRVRAVTRDGLVLEGGEPVAADAVLVTSHAKAPPVLANGDLARDERGFLAIDETLRVIGEDAVFAAGDCATMIDHPRPKAGVFAVRQGSPLARNLRAVLRGEPLQGYVPQKDWLMLIASADGRAIASRGAWLAYEGRLAWWLKDRIDQRFMKLFRV